MSHILILDGLPEADAGVYRAIAESFPERKIIIEHPGAGGLKLFQKHKPAVVFLDVFTTGLHGIRLCEQLSAADANKESILIAMTDWEEGRKNGEMALGAGADMLMYKPLLQKECLNTLRMLLRLRDSENTTRHSELGQIKTIDNLKQEVENLKKEQSITEQTLGIERSFAGQVLNTMGQGLTVINRKGIFQYVNPAYARMIGYSVEELNGRTPEAFTLDEDHAALEKAQREREKGQTTSYETRLIHRKGHYVPVTITGVPYFAGKEVLGSIAVITNITELLKTRSKLDSLARVYESVFQLSKDGMFLVDVISENTFRINRINKAHQEISGLSPESVAGKTPEEILGQEEGRKIVKNYQKCLSQGKSISYEEKITFNDGRVTWWKTTLNLLVTDHNKRFILGVSSDISHYKLMEQRLKDMEGKNAQAENLTGPDPSGSGSIPKVP